MQAQLGLGQVVANLQPQHQSGPGEVDSGLVQRVLTQASDPFEDYIRKIDEVYFE